MSWFHDFWHQENKPYRNFQIAYTILTLNFILPAISYFLTPDTAWENFQSLARLFGSTDYPFPENSQYWRILGAGNVMTLGFMCFLLQVNLRKYYPTLLPLVFLKGCSAFGFLGVYEWIYPYSLFLIAFVFDGVTMCVMIYFATSARKSLDTVGTMSLVPQPLGAVDHA